MLPMPFLFAGSSCFSCCCSLFCSFCYSCWKTKPYVVVFDVCNPDKEFKLINGEVVPVDYDELQMSNERFDQEVEALTNDDGSAVDENEIELRKLIEDIA